MGTPSHRVLWACISWQSRICSDGDIVLHLHSSESAALSCPSGDDIEELEVFD